VQTSGADPDVRHQREGAEPDVLERDHQWSRGRRESLAVATPDVAVNSETKPFEACLQGQSSALRRLYGDTADDEVYIIAEAISARARPSSGQDGGRDGENDFEGTIARFNLRQDTTSSPTGISRFGRREPALVVPVEGNQKQVVVWTKAIAEGR